MTSSAHSCSLDWDKCSTGGFRPQNCSCTLVNASDPESSSEAGLGQPKAGSTHRPRPSLVLILRARNFHMCHLHAHSRMAARPRRAKV